MVKTWQDASEEDSSVTEDVVAQLHREIVEAFPDLDLSGFDVAARILVLAAHVNQTREAVLGGYGLTLAEYDVLATMYRHDGPGGVNPRTLREWITVSSGGLTKRLDRLEDRGLIARGPDPNDRRGVRLALTGEGRTLFRRALPAVVAAERELVGHGVESPEQQQQLTGLLQRLVGACQRRAPHDRR